MKRLALLGALVLLLLTIAAPASAKQDKQWICHETHSTTNHWIVINVAQGWDHGHGSDGPAWHQHVTGEHGDKKLESHDDKAGPARMRGFDEGDCGGGGGPA